MTGAIPWSRSVIDYDFPTGTRCEPVKLAGTIRYEVIMSDGTVLAQAATRTAAWKIAAIRLQEADDDTE